MKVSARNVLPGRIRSIVPGTVNAEVTLTLAGDDELVAVVTQASVRELGLAVGGEASAIVKAPWVVLCIDAAPSASSVPARNLLRGTVSALHAGPVAADVTLRLQGGTEVHAVVTPESLRELGLTLGTPACALIKASQIMLAV